MGPSNSNFCKEQLTTAYENLLLIPNELLAFWFLECFSLVVLLLLLFWFVFNETGSKEDTHSSAHSQEMSTP